MSTPETLDEMKSRNAEEEVAKANAPEAVPNEVTMAQFREELSNAAYDLPNDMSLREAVQAAVEQAGIVMLDWWDTSAVVQRHNPKVLAMAEGFGIPTAVLDAIFIGAAKH